MGTDQNKNLGGKAARNSGKALWKFSSDNDGSFVSPDADYISRLYFPLMNQAGMKSSVTPELKGDICRSFGNYLTVATVTEELHRNMTGRNFWLKIDGQKPWSVAGTGVFQKSAKWLNNSEYSEVQGKIGAFSVVRGNRSLGLRVTTTVFVPANEDVVEIMYIEIENLGNSKIEFIPTSALPVFGRHADNIRDHRQVTTMFQRTYLMKNGIRVKPSIVHDEHGHSVNTTNYVVLGFDQKGSQPRHVWGSFYDFIGEGGSFDNPEAIFKSAQAPRYPGDYIDGKEALAAFRFEKVTVKPGEKIAYHTIHGITDDEKDIEHWNQKYDTSEKIEQVLQQTLDYWQQLTGNVSFKTENTNFDNWMKWVSFQLKCRQIFGNSYLPDFGYGRGGRGWRDLWQDLLSIFLVDPDNARQEIINNFLGIRVDGSNATIIGTKPGEFIADRNNVPRTWCDHGSWPVFVLNFYIQQTGDYDILFKELTYWKDVFVYRSKQRDKKWNEDYGFSQKTADGKVYSGSVFEHILLQQLSAFFHVGAHNNLLLEGADWNDTLDMAREKGESVCFHNFYSGNLKTLVNILQELQNKGYQKIILLQEIRTLLDRLPGQQKVNYASPKEKQQRLAQYFESVRHTVSGKQTEIPITDLIEDLAQKASSMVQHIRENEWVSTVDRFNFFNGHYDNDSQAVHGDHPLGVRMDLTSQVMPIMFDVATEQQIAEIYRSANKYLKDDGKGLRVCTDFKELKLNLGRITGFLYGQKEHGSKWMQQNIMFMYGLYKRGFVNEAYQVFKDVADLCLDSGTARVFPGVPSYFEPGDRGAYMYLTGSSTWLMLTVTTQMFGVAGEKGNFSLMPRLTSEQFGKSGTASINCNFRGKRLNIRYHNPGKQEWDQYRIKSVLVNDKPTPVILRSEDKKAVIPAAEFDSLCTRDINSVLVELG